MDLTYFESRLKASIAMLNAAKDPCARFAHKRLIDGYRKLVLSAQMGLQRKGGAPSSSPSTGNALLRWADDGGASRSTK